MKSFKLTASGVLLVLLSTVTIAFACSSGPRIWMPEGSADFLYQFWRGGKTGYIDQTGKIVIPPTIEASRWNSGGEFHDGLAQIGTIGTNGIYIGKDGKRAFKQEFLVGWDFSEGLAVAVPKDGDKFGYIDTTGKFVISPRFRAYPDGVDSFSGGFAKISDGLKIGYIDRTGAFAIPLQFLRGRSFHEGMAAVVVEGPCFYVDDGACGDTGLAGAKGIPAVDPPRCKYTFIDKTARVISSERYDMVRDFSEGTAPVRIGKLWGYIDKSGRMVIPPKFEDALPFKDGLARVRIGEGEAFGYINRAGTIVIPAQFPSALSFSEGLAVVFDAEDRSSYIDKTGKPAFNGKKFSVASSFYGGLAHVHLPNGAYAYINQSGKAVFTYRR